MDIRQHVLRKRTSYYLVFLHFKDLIAKSMDQTIQQLKDISDFLTIVEKDLDKSIGELHRQSPKPGFSVSRVNTRSSE